MKRSMTLTLTVALLLGGYLQLGLHAAQEPQKKPFAVEYYYKVKWGHFSEFMELYKRNHYPVLKKLQQQGDIVEMKAAYPRHHSGEGSRWDFRFTIVWKDVERAHADPDLTALLEALFPDQERFLKEEQRRFEILLEHTDVPIVEEDLELW